MTIIKLTKQGVRNLDTPRNGRTRPQTVGCFHDFKHYSDCYACWASNFGGYTVPIECEEYCTKCGKRR